ncbi:hypothetical protein GCM10020000_34330 [Streptomyces olivoverticillatus]
MTDVEFYAARMERAVRSAVQEGLAGLVVAPGPDLVWLCGYEPHVTERLTALLLAPGRKPQLIVPQLERPDAEKGARCRLFGDHRLGRRRRSVHGRRQAP